MLMLLRGVEDDDGPAAKTSAADSGGSSGIGVGGCVSTVMVAKFTKGNLDVLLRCLLRSKTEFLIP